MSELKDHLIVHYPLADTTKVNRVIGSNAEIIFSNTVTQVTDQHFSKVLQAPDKGDHAIKITGIDLHKTYEQQKQLSFSFWLHFGKRVTKHISILQLGLSGSSDLKAFINCEPDPSEGTLFTADLQYKSKSHYKTLQLSGWTHVTLVYTATQATFWINGEVGLQQSITGNPFLSNSAIWLLPYISQNVLITQFRLYNCTLTAENIYTIQQEDLGKSGLDLLPKIPEGPRPSIFHFSLEDQNHQPHLYIKNQNAQLSDSYLTITNKTDTPLLFQQLTLQNHAPTADQCHLELRFRPGTLKLDDTTHPIQLNDANTTWVMSAADVHQDSYVSFYFAHKDSFVINAQASMKLAIQNLHAQIGHDGARGTRIEIRYHNIYITDNQGKHSLLSESLSGYLQQAINVVNQLGVQNESLKPTGLPFHVGFLGSNTILNDGSADNTLILKITNNRDHDIVFKQATNPASDFMLSFDQGEMDWAVGTMDEINEVEIQVITATQADQLNTLEAILAKREAVQGQSSFDTNGKLMEEVFDYTDWKVIKNEEDAITTWTLHRQHDDLSIAPEHSIFIVISKLISSTPDGTGNLYLDYHDLGKGDHSYADGRYTVSIQKSPIVYRGQHVGIGTNTPNAKLQVAGGDVRVDFGNLIVDKGAVSSKYIGLKNVISGEMSDYVFAGMLSAQQYLVFQGKTPEEPFQLFQLTEERQLKALSITEYITPDVYYTAPFISNDALYGLGSDNSYAYQNDPSNRPFYLFKYDLQHKTKTKTRVTNPLKWDNRPCVQAWKYGQKLYLFFYDRALNNSPSDKELGYIDLNTHTYMSLFKDSAIEMNLLPQVYQDATPSFLYFKIRRWQNPQEPHDKWIMVDLNSSEKTEVTAAQLSKNIQKDINGTVNLTHEHNGFKLFFTGNLVMYPYTLHDVQQPSKFITVNTTPAMPTNDQAGYATFFYKDKYINFLNGRLIITSIQNPVRPTIIVDTERQGVKADAEFSKVMQTGPKILAVNDDYIFMIEDSFDPKDVYIVDMHQNGSAFSYQKIRISHNSTITSI
ncbi:MAG: LamG-like jellyroll fold domain-containing protein, partial [Flammeovirgaceae bacterium]